MKTLLTGATVICTPLVTIKRGSRDIALQGEYMRTLPECAKVYRVGRTWYAMETLAYHEEEYWPAHAALDALENIWGSGHGVQDTAWPYRLEMQLSTIDSPLLPFVQQVARDIAGQPLVVTHGDPTWENTMSRNGRVVFIDPVTPRSYLPASPLVDLGKMMQSALGWERHTKGWHVDKFTRGTIISRAMEYPCSEWLWFFTALCFERIRKRRPEYVPEVVSRLISSRQIFDLEW